ncbi:MAG TPA: hypothetical protein VGM07_16760 [Stellaceae bacterium]
MSGEPLPTAEYYRNVAAEIRQVAERAQLPEVRRDLLDMAERFDRLAEHVERRDPCRAG